ncbi:DUF4468 domain-containing protein [Membranihabitans marinus]|uniref:DUF4468 domain-containing protein n=1 Tax=Membranihabitans marinus TaxID=1227546 RepID=UPI001F406AAB|nr:DUF4468 domain-containing protein [Membranihabitans marinus]
MKKLLYVLMVSFTIGCTPQLRNQIEYNDERIIEIEDYPQEHLMVNTIRWMTRLFNDLGNVIQYHDKEAGVIVGKFLVDSESFDITNVRMSVEVLAKDDKVRLIFRSSFYPISSDEVVIPDKLPKRAVGYYKLVQEKEETRAVRYYDSTANQSMVSMYWDAMTEELKWYLIQEKDSL